MCLPRLPFFFPFTTLFGPYSMSSFVDEPRNITLQPYFPCPLRMHGDRDWKSCRTWAVLPDPRAFFVSLHGWLASLIRPQQQAWPYPYHCG